MSIIATTNIHVPLGESLPAGADLHYPEGEPTTRAFVTLDLGPVSVFLRDRKALETLRAAVAKADDLLAQVEAARAVENMPGVTVQSVEFDARTETDEDGEPAPHMITREI